MSFVVALIGLTTGHSHRNRGSDDSVGGAVRVAICPSLPSETLTERCSTSRNAGGDSGRSTALRDCGRCAVRPHRLPPFLEVVLRQGHEGLRFAERTEGIQPPNRVPTAIDEIERHLHQSWQQRVLADLARPSRIPVHRIHPQPAGADDHQAGTHRRAAAGESRNRREPASVPVLLRSVWRRDSGGNASGTNMSQ